MTRIRFEDNERKIHTIDTGDGSYLEEQTVIGEDNDYLVFSVYFPDETEINVVEEVFYKLQSAGLKINRDSRVWFDALDNHSYLINSDEKYTLREDTIISYGRNYTKFYLYTESTFQEVEISKRVFIRLRDKGIPVEHN